MDDPNREMKSKMNLKSSFFKNLKQPNEKLELQKKEETLSIQKTLSKKKNLKMNVYASGFK